MLNNKETGLETMALKYVSDTFKFHICMLKLTSIWPNENILLRIIPFGIASYGGLNAIFGIVYSISTKLEDNVYCIGCAVGLTDYLGYAYARWCIRSSLADIIYLMDFKEIFGKFYPTEKFLKTTNYLIKLAKCMIWLMFFVYGLCGNVLYNVLVLYDREGCNERKPEVLQRRDPCGFAARGYLLHDANKFPLFQIYFVLQIIGCFAITIGILMCAMTQIGMVHYTIDQLRWCRELINNLKMGEDAKSTKKSIRQIIKYHVTIITYSKMVDKAFSKMLLLHLTLTSLVISVLGFVILTSDSYADILRHCLHLCGWVMLLSLSCYYGQRLIDESLSISADIYNMPWHLAHPSIQKDIQMIMMRGQIKLKMTCAGVGEMSLETFLTIMKSAYSYLTLLLKLKD